MIDDLKNYKGEPDSFQLIDPDLAVFILVMLGGACAIFWPYW